MPDFKIPLGVAAFAFVLSFLIGLFSGVSFLHVIIKAIIFAAIFFGISIAGSFLIQKYLIDLIKDENDLKTSTGESLVDINIGDDDLITPIYTQPSDANGEEELVPDFVQHKKTDIAQISRETSGNDIESTASRNPPETDVPTPQNKPEIPKKNNETVLSADGLDILPDLEDFSTNIKQDNLEDPIEASLNVRDSSFGGQSSSFADNSVASAEADLMAKAIRTILAKDT